MYVVMTLPEAESTTTEIPFTASEKTVVPAVLPAAEAPFFIARFAITLVAQRPRWRRQPALRAALSSTV